MTTQNSEKYPLPRPPTSLDSQTLKQFQDEMDKSKPTDHTDPHYFDKLLAWSHHFAFSLHAAHQLNNADQAPGQNLSKVVSKSV